MRRRQQRAEAVEARERQAADVETNYKKIPDDRHNGKGISRFEAGFDPLLKI